MNKIQFYKTRKVKTPKVATEGSVGIDFFTTRHHIIPGETYYEIPLGLVVHVPEGTYLHIYPRTSFFEKWMLFHVGSGVVDPDYCGPHDEIHFQVYNPLRSAVTIPANTRICQGVLHTLNPISEVEILENPPQKENRGGIGSTGVA